MIPTSNENGLEKILGSKPMLPNCFQDIVYSDFFASIRGMYEGLELKAIQWHEKEAQKAHKGKQRITGGPAYRHIKECVEGVIKINQELSQREEVNQTLIELAELRKVPYNPNSGVIKLPLIIYFTTIAHDTLEDDKELSKLNTKYKNAKNKIGILKKELGELEEDNEREIGKKEKSIKSYSEKSANLLEKINVHRESFWNVRYDEFVQYLTTCFKEEEEDIKQRSRQATVLVKEKSVRGVMTKKLIELQTELARRRMNGIINQFRSAEKSLRSLTRATEERSYTHSLYHFFDITERSGMEGSSHLDILVKSLAKLRDRCANVSDVKRQYSRKEKEQYIDDVFRFNIEFRKKYGTISLRQGAIKGKSFLYNIGKSIIVLNALNRKVLTSEIPQRVMDRGDFMENYLLNLVNLSKDDLISRTKQALEERIGELEGSMGNKKEDYIAKVDEEVRRYRAEGHYRRATTSEEDSFGHGTLELLTDKQRLKKQFGQLDNGRKTLFEYETARNCLEVIKDFEEKDGHCIVGLTDNLNPKMVEENQYS
jgi:hypothetical protein